MTKENGELSSGLCTTTGDNEVSGNITVNDEVEKKLDSLPTKELECNEKEIKLGANEGNSGSKRTVEEDESEVKIDEKSLESLTEEICKELKEDNRDLLRILLRNFEAETSKEILIKAIEIEKGDGIVTADGKRRKTPGGVFLHLVRDRLGRSVFNRICQQEHKQRKKLKVTTKKTIKTEKVQNGKGAKKQLDEDEENEFEETEGNQSKEEEEKQSGEGATATKASSE